MATLAELWTEQPSTKIAPEVQRGRDAESIKILQTEWRKTTNPSDRAAIGRELTKLGGEIPTGPAAVTAPAASVPSSGTLADLWGQVPAEEPAAPSAAPKAAPASVADVFRNLTYAPADIYRALTGGLEAGAQLVTGAVTAPVAGLAGLARTMLPGEPGAGAETTRAVQQALTYQPKTPQGQATAELIHKGFEAAALGAPGRGERVLEATKSPMAGMLVEQLTTPLNLLPVVPLAARGARAATAPMREQFARMKAEIEPPPVVAPTAPTAPTIPAGPTSPTPAAIPGLVEQFRQKKAPGAPGGSVGAAGATQQSQVNAALSSASPELRAALEKHAPEKLDVNVINRHLEAESLPVPVRLTEGQATQDVVRLSNELNRRGKHPELAEHFNQQNQALIDNLNAINPGASGVRLIDNSEAIIQAYKALDEAKKAKINEAYAKLTEANGGALPIDTASFVKNADAMLSKQYKTEFLSAPISKTLDRLRSGEPMTFEQFEALRTTLAEEIRRAKTARDGNAQKASSIVLDALEQMPLSPEASGLKSLADQARALAKDRFKALEKDRAYDAAVFDTVPADKFIDKFVINGINRHLNQMVQNLGENSVAHQQMTAGTLNWLKERAGIRDEAGNFSQAGFNKALDALDKNNNLRVIFGPEAANSLQTLGRVARYTQAQPKGSYVNTSNTMVTQMAEKAAQLAETAANVVGGGKYGLPVGTMVRQKAQAIKAAREVEKALEPGAGSVRKD